MQIRNLPLTAILVATVLGGGMGCKRSAEARAQDATTLVRAMDKEILDAQKKAIDAFKALPTAESDLVRMNLGAAFDNLAISEKNYSTRSDVLESNLISKQKDAKEDALIGELRLYAKTISSQSQEASAKFESVASQTKQKLDSGQATNEQDKAAGNAIVKACQLETEFEKTAQAIASSYQVKLEKLL